MAARTGVGHATLRQWETRYGFPVPARLPSGHRRYAEADVERVRQVVRDRDAGLSLKVAIDRVLKASAAPEESIFAGLRRRRPDLVPYTLPKRTLIALSHAIEDECAARAERPAAVRLVPARPLLPRRRAALARARAHGGADDRLRRLPQAARAEGRPGRGADRPLRPARPRVDAGLRRAALRRLPVGLGAARPGRPPRPRPRARDDLVASSRRSCARRRGSPRASRGGRRRTSSTAIDAVLSEDPPASGEEFRLVSALTNRMVAYVGRGAVSALPEPHAYGLGVTPSDSTSAGPRGVIMGTSISFASSQVANADAPATAPSDVEARAHDRPRHVQQPPPAPVGAQHLARPCRCR